jgi:predicted nucleic acid-binding protein
MDTEQRVICDTDVLIDYWNEGAARHAIVREVLDSRIGVEHVTISVITWLELLRGVHDKTQQSRILKRLNDVSVLMLNDAIGRRSMELMRHYHLAMAFRSLMV